MTAMFMLLDHSFQRLKNAAETPADAAADRPSEQPAEPNGKQPARAQSASAATSLGELSEQFAHVEACLRESKRFLDDLTIVARTGAVEMEPSRVELSSIVEEVLFEQSELLAERSAQVEVAADLPAVWCNPWRAKQVITNLVRNAVRHGCDPQGPRITITRRLPTKADSRFEWIAVHDNGQGIPVESREIIFEPGRRLPSAHSDGMGMGLSIVLKIVQHYGGTVFVEPSGPGTTFVLSLPALPKSTGAE